VSLYCDLVARAAIDGISRAQGAAGVDVGAQEQVTEGALEGEAPAKGRRGQRRERKADKTDKTGTSRTDDFKKINGIGPVLEGKLHDLGIISYRQIADMTADDIERLETELNIKGRVDREDWAGQARALAGQAEAA
jgi:small subunit ribosomal protein S2